MKLYAYLESSLRLAEGIGEIRKVELSEKSAWCGDRIDISGDTEDGEIFTVTIKIEEGDAD